jgi:two-component system, NarL family, sensor kinase
MDPEEKRIYTAILLTCLVLGVIIIFFVASSIRQQRRNLELHRQNILAEITTLEKERARMAHDLHDELAPMLAAIKLKINSFDLHDESDRSEMVKTNDHIDSLLKRIREITFELLPNSLLRKGLIGATHEFVEMISKHSLIEIHFKSELIGPLSEEKTVNLYRILQEVVYNTVKHSGATVLQISINSQKGKVVLATTDNGKGFDYDKTLNEGNGIGLRSLKSRVEIMNGEFFIESKKGTGTSYIFQIPQS